MPKVSLVQYDGEGWAPIYGEKNPVPMDDVPRRGDFVKTYAGTVAVFEVLAVMYDAGPSGGIELYLGKPSSEPEFYAARLQNL